MLALMCSILTSVNITVSILVGVIAAIHVYIALFESFLWTQRGPKVFRSFPTDLFPKTTAMAVNMGAYNAVLAAGLMWSLTLRGNALQPNVTTFFLISVVFVGIVGAFTAEKRIFFVQAAPAMVALLLVWL